MEEEINPRDQPDSYFDAIWAELMRMRRAVKRQRDMPTQKANELSDEQLLRVLEMLDDRVLLQTIARKIGMSIGSVGNIKRGIIYKERIAKLRAQAKPCTSESPKSGRSKGSASSLQFEPRRKFTPLQKRKGSRTTG